MRGSGAPHAAQPHNYHIHSRHGQGRMPPMVRLLLLFFASGCAALIYETVWFYLVQLVVGASSISVAVILSAFMGGMALGSWLLPKLIPSRSHPLRVVAALEAGIGLCGLAIPLADREVALGCATSGVGRHAVHGQPRWRRHRHRGRRFLSTPGLRHRDRNGRCGSAERDHRRVPLDDGAQWRRTGTGTGTRPGT